MVEFDQFKNEVGRHAFTMSPQKWIGNQIEALKNNKNIKELEVLQQQVNEDNKYLIENK